MELNKCRKKNEKIELKTNNPKSEPQKCCSNDDDVDEDKSVSEY